VQQGNAVSKRKFAGTDSRFHGRRQISPRFSAQALLLLLLSAPVLLFTTSVAWQRRAAMATAGDVTTSQALNSVDNLIVLSGMVEMHGVGVLALNTPQVSECAGSLG